MYGFDGSVEILLINRGNDKRVDARNSGWDIIASN